MKTIQDMAKEEEDKAFVEFMAALSDTGSTPDQLKNLGLAFSLGFKQGFDSGMNGWEKCRTINKENNEQTNKRK